MSSFDTERAYIFYEVFFISDKQTFYVMKFLKTISSQKLSHTYFLKSQVVTLEEMIFDKLNRVQHEFENKGNLKKLAYNDLYLKKKKWFKSECILLFLSSVISKLTFFLNNK